MTLAWDRQPRVGPSRVLGSDCGLDSGAPAAFADASVQYAQCMEPLIGDVVADRYVLLRKLASGGMGTLWAARHSGLDCEVGVKFITELDCTPEAVKRFELEARAAAKVRGRHVVHTYDFGFHGERPYLVMELLQGETLGSLMLREGALEPRDALFWLEQLAKGLQLVHSAGIVHRDIKPSNVFVAREGSDRCLKLLDFGIAKSSERGEALSSERVLGSPGYMSPEQARGRPVDVRSDLWSVAVIAFELLSGRSLFAQHLRAAGAPAWTEAIPTLSELGPLDPTFEAFFARGLARTASCRFQDIAELIAAFRLACQSGALVSREMPGAATRGRDGPTQPIESSESITGSGALELSLPSHGSRGTRRPWALVPASLIATGMALAATWPVTQILWSTTSAHRPALANSSGAEAKVPSQDSIRADRAASTPAIAEPSLDIPSSVALPARSDLRTSQRAPRASKRPRSAPERSSARPATPAPAYDPFSGLTLAADTTQEPR